MKKSAGVLLLHSLAGMILFILLAFINQQASDNSLTMGMLIIPSMVGLFAGSLVGYSRKKWMDQSAELNVATRELEDQLASVAG